MASFAKLGLNNKVIEVNSVVNEVLHDSNGVEQENIGIDFLNNLYQTNDTWIQTSYNTKGGQHTLGGTPFRKNFAGVGYTYDEDKDAFIAPKPYASWTLNEDTCIWEAPVAYPDDGQKYNWNETTISWELIE